MNKIHILTGVACVSVFLATGAFAEILGVQPGTSDNPKDNVPKEIQRGTPGGGTFGEGGTGPGTRSKALTGMEKGADPVTRQAKSWNTMPNREVERLSPQKISMRRARIHRRKA